MIIAESFDQHTPVGRRLRVAPLLQTCHLQTWVHAAEASHPQPVCSATLCWALRHRLHNQSRCQSEPPVPECTAVSVKPVDNGWRAIHRADAHPSGFAGATATLTTSHAAVLCAARVCTRTVKLRSCTDQGDLCGVLGLPATSLYLAQLRRVVWIKYSLQAEEYGKWYVCPPGCQHCQV